MVALLICILQCYQDIDNLSVTELGDQGPYRGPQCLHVGAASRPDARSHHQRHVVQTGQPQRGR
jgi:hypothetical protein